MRAFKRYFKLTYDPVGVKIESEDFEAETDPRKLRYCEAVKLAAEGKRIIITRDNLDCFGAEQSLGFVEPVFGKDTKAVVIEPYSPEGDYDAVLLIATPEKIMDLSLVYYQLFREKLEARFSGEKAVCGEATAQVILNGKPNISFLCHGARTYGNYGSDEIVIGIPPQIFRKICSHLEKKQIKSMCGCLTDDIPKPVVERLENIGFYKATDHFAGMFEGKIVKLHVFKGEDAIGIFTSLKFSSEDEAKSFKSEFEETLSMNRVHIYQRENWLDLSKIIEFEGGISKAANNGEFDERIRREISSLVNHSKMLSRFRAKS